MTSGYDTILHTAGELGLFQKRIVVCCFTATMVSSFSLMSAVFTIALPPHRCRLPPELNGTHTAIYDEHQTANNVTISINAGTANDLNQCYITGFDNKTKKKCNSWVYDTSVFETTAVTQFDWVCDDKVLRSHAIMSFMLGLLFGGAIFGPLGDTIGRKPTFMIGLVIQTISGFCLVVTTGFYSFTITRVIMAIGAMPVYNSCYNIGMEIVGAKKRVIVSQSMMYSYSVGTVILCGLAYFIRDWVILQIVITAIPIPMLLYWWLLPESPRWLLAKGRRKEAEAIIRHAAKVNKKPLPDDLFKNLTLEDDQPNLVNRDKFWHLFLTPLLAVRTLVIMYDWFVTSMLYYGISLSADSYHGDVYVNFLLCALAEIPAFTIVLFIVNRIGRRKTMLIAFLSGGLACISAIFPAIYAPELGALVLVMALIGKLCASMTFSMVYMYTAEMFPTVIRVFSMAVCFIFGRLGSLVAPYIADLGDFIGGHLGHAMPLVTFGALALLAGIFTFVLPETLNTPLPDTIEDIKNLGTQPQRKKTIANIPADDIAKFSANTDISECVDDENMDGINEKPKLISRVLDEENLGSQDIRDRLLQ